MLSAIVRSVDPRVGGPHGGAGAAILSPPADPTANGATRQALLPQAALEDFPFGSSVIKQVGAAIVTGSVFCCVRAGLGTCCACTHVNRCTHMQSWRVSVRERALFVGPLDCLEALRGPPCCEPALRSGVRSSVRPYDMQSCIAVRARPTQLTLS